ncbi:MAG: hypothetical protein ACE5JU_10830 [Candidatus Binatia bacterium]
MKEKRLSIVSQVRALQEEVRSLREEVRREREEVLVGALLRRGFRCFSKDGSVTLILPMGDGSRERFYRLLRKYSFRLFLRDVIRNRESFSLRDLLRYCSEESARAYLSVLVQGGLIERFPRRRFRLRDQRIISFGDTLEWLVCQILEREFHIPAAWGLRVEDNQRGGDFDVIGLMEGSFIYIEVKSSPPKHIEQQEVGAFFDRLETLRPHLAIFLEDTQLRMKDKIVVMFEEELRSRYGPSWRGGAPLVRLEREIFGISDRLFITNSDPDLVVNIGFCLGRYLRSQGVQLGWFS